jgi:hypothetical protein
MVCTHSSSARSLLRRCGTAAVLAASALLLAACGGGGGGGDGQPVSRFLPSSSLANMCTADGPKQFLRSYMDEVYLWYDEIPEVDANNYSTVQAYFDALLVRSLDSNGQVKDRWSVVGTTEEIDAWLGVTEEFAAALKSDPAVLQAAGGGEAVTMVTVVNSPGGRKTGYIRFDDQVIGAQDELITAFTQLREQQVQDLVLDMRINGGGYLYVAAAAASMVAGPANEGRVFEKLRYNAKRPSDTADSFVLFSSQVQIGETQYPRGTALPQLALPRVYVLTSEDTCSASESIVNGLRGIDVQVVLIGGKTCGKPYGFRRKDNCGMSFLPIEFQGLNAKGYGDYTAGFTPNCTVAGDDSLKGDPSEPMLAAALHHIDTGTCPPGSSQALATGVELSTQPLASSRPRTSRPPWAGRLLISQQQP